MLIAVSSWAAVNRSFASLALAEPWWEMGKTEANITPGEYLIVRELPNMDALAVDSFDLLLRAETTFSNPKIDQQTHTGTFVNVSVELLAQQERGVTVRQTLKLVSTLTGSGSAALATNFATLTSLNTRDNAILNLFGLQTGEGDNQGFIFTNMNPSDANKTACMDTITDADLVAQLAVGWTYADRHWKEEKGGAATFSVAFRKVAWTNTWSDDAQQMGDGRTFGWARVRTDMVDGVNNTNRAALLSAALTADSGFVVSAVSLSEGADGQLSANRHESYVSTSTANSAAVITLMDDDDTTGEREIRREWRRVTESTKDTLTSSNGNAVVDYAFVWPGDASITTNAHVRATVDDHGDGAYTVRQSLKRTGLIIGIGSKNWDEDHTSIHVQTRSTDNKVRTLTYKRQVSNHGTEQNAWQEIGTAATTEDVVRGSESVRRVGKDQWQANWTELVSIGDWITNTY